MLGFNATTALLERYDVLMSRKKRLRWFRWVPGVPAKLHRVDEEMRQIAAILYPPYHGPRGRNT